MIEQGVIPASLPDGDRTVFPRWEMSRSRPKSLARLFTGWDKVV
jgi:hypothetical protein